jgi:hypothetical protein
VKVDDMLQVVILLMKLLPALTFALRWVIKSGDNFFCSTCVFVSLKIILYSEVYRVTFWSDLNLTHLGWDNWQVGCSEESHSIGSAIMALLPWKLSQWTKTSIIQCGIMMVCMGVENMQLY